MQLRAIGDIIFADVFGKRTNRHAVYCSHAIEWDQTCVDRIRNKVPCATAKALRMRTQHTGDTYCRSKRFSLNWTTKWPIVCR